MLSDIRYRICYDIYVEEENRYGGELKFIESILNMFVF